MHIENFLIDTYSNKVYQFVDGSIVDDCGIKHAFDPNTHTRLVVKTDLILLFNYMKRRVFEGDLVCALQNIGTKFERWWTADRFSPEGRVFSADGNYSCRIQDAIPLKSIDPVWLFDDDLLQMEEWLLQITSEVEYKRLKASQELLKRFVRFQEKFGNSINKLVM